MPSRFPLKTLHDLEWPRLLGRLAERCTGEEAAARCLELPFLEEPEARQRLALVQEVSTCLDAGDPPPALPARPVGAWLARIRGGAGVSADGLVAVAGNLQLFVAVARYFDNRRDKCPGNFALVVPADGNAALVSLSRLAAEIASCFEPDGALADAASPELARLRRKVVSLRKALLAEIERIADKEADLLQDRTVTIRNERFVLPVRADAHRRLHGIVHGASGSGATVFVEPEGVIETGNDLMLAREEVIREEQRVLARLCEAVRDEMDIVAPAAEELVAVEVRIAAARLARDLAAAVPLPADPGVIALKRARHPLLVLDGVAVVPCDVSGAPGSCLVISGPNAGGKTVVLKTIGLMGLMLAAGLPIPATADSRFAVPRSVLTDIGDEQSLEKSLSTFSAHVTNLASILGRAGVGAIALLDELAAGTDPTEGASLAEAILESLNTRRATSFATTHFDALKSRAHSREGFSNAAVGFDMKRMSPTFELHQGVPGSSSALAIAERFGAPADVVVRARELLPGGARELAQTVAALEEERRRLFFERQALTEARRSAEEAERERVAELARLKAKEERFIDKERETLWSAIRSAREKVRDAETSLRRRRGDAEAIGKARREINALAENLAPGKAFNPAAIDSSLGPQLEPDRAVPGTTVFVASVGKKGVVESSPKGGNVFVRVGNVKLRARLLDLRLAAPEQAGGPPRAGKKATPRPSEPQATAETLRTSDNTIDLRGLTVDEAVAAVDRFLDEALCLDAPAVFILHGHGTGALREAIRTHLASSPYVTSFRPGTKDEGGDGVTAALLR